MNTLADLATRPYRLEVVWSAPESPDAPGWVARVRELDGCQAQGDTPEQLEENMRRALEAWLGACLDDDLPIPEPGSESTFTWIRAGDPEVPVLVLESTSGFAARYRELLFALSHESRAKAAV